MTKLTEELAPGYSISVESEKKLATADGPFPLEIHETNEFGRTLYMGGHFMTSERDEFVYHELMVHPAMIASRNAERVLIIGGGDGGAVEEVCKHPNVEFVRLVEIDKAVVEFSHEHLSSINRGMLNTEHVDIVIRDGYDYMETMKHDKEFDVIILDLTDPEGPAERLYSKDFLEMCQKALTMDGTFVLHLGPVWTNPARVEGLANRVREVFHTVHPFTAFVPLYGTLWTFALCRNNRMMPSWSYVEGYLKHYNINRLQYYSAEVHDSMFKLPVFVRDVVGDNLKRW